MSNDLTSGLSRRLFMRNLGIASVAATSFPALAAMQQAPAAGAAAPGAPGAAGGRRGGRGGAGGGMGGGDFGGSPDPDMVKISSNENPLGPSDLARWAIASTGALGGRYGAGIGLGNQPSTILATEFSLQPGFVQLYAGSGGALDLAAYTMLKGGKDLVVGSPSYNQGQSAGTKMGVKVHLVPLTATGAHDVKAMLAASTSVGGYYICNPCNPTGTMTPKSDIEWLVKNKPEGSVVLIDEAYHHFSTDESSIDLVGKNKDVVVLRTFSKVYGMAGLRAGFMIANPDFHEAVRNLGIGVGTGVSVSCTTIAACIASMNDKTLIPIRRKINADIRENVLEWMDKNGYEYMKGSQANFFQVNVKRPGREFSQNMLKEKVQIGRTWVEMPNYSRITVGTQAEMDKFKIAFKKCYEMAPAPATSLLNMPFTENPSELDFHKIYA
jgi:histidinol-phosphate aminotransferase